MPNFFIEVSHEPDAIACAKAIHVFQQSGSHLLTNAEWGCADGDHCALFIAEAEAKGEIMNIIPPAYRNGSRVVELRRFEPVPIQRIIDEHEG